jgi:hypothetical protein
MKLTSLGLTVVGLMLSGTGVMAASSITTAPTNGIGGATQTTPTNPGLAPATPEMIPTNPGLPPATPEESTGRALGTIPPQTSGYLRRFFDVAKHIRRWLATPQRRGITTPLHLMALRRLRPATSFCEWCPSPLGVGSKGRLICLQSTIATAPRIAVVTQSSPRTSGGAYTG